MKSILAFLLVIVTTSAFAAEGQFTLEKHLALMSCDRLGLKDLLLSSFNAHSQDSILYKVTSYVEGMTVGKEEWRVWPKGSDHPKSANDVLNLELEIVTIYYDEKGNRTNLDQMKHSEQKLIGFRVF